MGTLVHRSRSALRGQILAKVEVGGLQLSSSMENCPRITSNLGRVVEKVRIRDPLQGPFRNGVPTGEGMLSVRL